MLSDEQLAAILERVSYGGTGNVTEAEIVQMIGELRGWRAGAAFREASAGFADAIADSKTPETAEEFVGMAGRAPKRKRGGS